MNTSSNARMLGKNTYESGKGKVPHNKIVENRQVAREIQEDLEDLGLDNIRFIR